MTKPPAFQFYADDFVAGVVDLPTEDVGAYILLLCFQWNRGSIPPHKTAVDRIAGCEVSKEVLAKFPGGKNARLEVERKKQAIYRAKQSKAGLASVQQRLNHRSTTVQPSLVPNVNSPSPSPSPIVERECEAANCPVIPPMTRQEFDTLCQMRAIPTECADWFWNTHDSRNWTDATGQAIRKVEPLLLNAATRWRANQSQAQATTKRNGHSIWELTKIIDAKKERCIELERRHASEAAGSMTWDKPEARAEWVQLRKEIKEHNQQLRNSAK